MAQQEDEEQECERLWTQDVIDGHHLLSPMWLVIHLRFCMRTMKQRLLLKDAQVEASHRAILLWQSFGRMTLQYLPGRGALQLMSLTRPCCGVTGTCLLLQRDLSGTEYGHIVCQPKAYASGYAMDISTVPFFPPMAMFCIENYTSHCVNLFAFFLTSLKCVI